MSAEYDPECSGELGKITIDMGSERIIESQLSGYDAVYPIYFNHALDALKGLAKTNAYPQEKLVMWH